MEVALKGQVMKLKEIIDSVSILVLMEVALKAAFPNSYSLSLSSFNPCFNGSGTQRTARVRHVFQPVMFQSLF